MSEPIHLQLCTDLGACDENGSLQFEDVGTPRYLVALGAAIICFHSSKSLFFDPLLLWLGTQAGHLTHGAEWVSQNQEKIENFANFSFRFLVRCAVTGLGALEFSNSPEWWLDTRELWANFPKHPMSNTVQVLYLLQLAYHMDDLFTVLYHRKSKRSDFNSMIIHHIVTILLLFGSTSQNCSRIGVIVSTLHAFPDIFLDFAKMSKHLEWKLASHIGLGCLFVAWIATRMLLYPCVYVWSTFTEKTSIHKGMARNTLVVFQFLLLALFLLNSMWFRMMIRLLVKVLKNGDADDPTTVKQKQQQKEENNDKKEETEVSLLHEEATQTGYESTASETTEDTDSTSSSEPLGKDFSDATYAYVILSPRRKGKTKTQ